MPVPTRPTKGTSGTQSYANDTLILASELNDESVALFGAFSNLDDTNVAAGANIDPSKIGDYSDSASEQKTASDPGSGSSLSAPTTLEGEIERLRYALERLSTGLDAAGHAKRYDGSSNVDVSWADRPSRGSNLALNGSFETKQSATASDPPDLWSAVGTITTAALATTDASEGAGRMLTVTTGAVTSGVSQTFTKLRASTRYLAVVRAKVTAGTAQLVTVGADATSQFRDITISTTSGTFTTLASIVQTDATPTALVVRLLGAGSGDVVHFDHMSLTECSGIASPIPRPFSAVSTTTTQVDLPVTTATDSGLSCVVVPPLPGFQIEARAKLCLYTYGGGASVEVRLKENGTIVERSYWSAPLDHSGTVVVDYTNQNPTPGTTYTYLVELYATTYAAQLNRTALGTPRSVMTVRVAI